MADLESQRTPLAPAGHNSSQSNDQQQFILPAMSRRSGNDKKSSKFIVYLLLIVVILSAALLFFSSIVWRITSPDLKITSVTVQSLLLGNSSNPWLNSTMKASITIDNSNFGRFRFDSCKAVVMYGNSTIGDGDITGGSVAGRETRKMDVTMIIGTANFNSSSDDFGVSGVVKFQSYAEMRGRVRVMKIAKRRVRVEMNCSMSLDLNKHSIYALDCR